MGLTATLVRFASETTYESLPDAVVKEAKRSLLEAVAVMVLGSGLKLGNTIGEVITKGEEPSEAMLVGRSDRCSLETAAFYNTAIADCNDSAGGYYRGAIHPGKNIIPAALTVASSLNIGGRDLILAIVMGIECCFRLAMVMATSHGARGHYADGTLGTIGSAIAVGKLFGLDKDSLSSAIGNAAMLAPSTVGGTSMFKSAGRPLAMGQSSASSILAVRMAQAGVSGPADILECPGGFCQALAGITDLSRVTEGLGENWESTLFYNKLFVGCSLTRLARQGAQALKKEHNIKAGSIQQVIVRQAKATLAVVEHHAGVGANIVEHTSSAPYLIANALMYDDNGPGVLTEERMNDPQVHELADKIEIIEDPELTKRWETEHCRGGSVEIVTKRGNRYSYYGEHVRGDPFDEWRMTDAELRHKFETFSRGILSRQKVDEITGMIFRLEQLDNTARIMNLLAREIGDIL